MEKSSLKNFENRYKNNFQLNKETAERPEILIENTVPESNETNVKQPNKTLMTSKVVKTVKSITKTAEDEISVKWKSTWLLEKVPDAKFEDGVMKITFKANKLYTRELQLESNTKKKSTIIWL